MKILLVEESETCAECLLGIYNKRWFCLATNKDIDLLKSRYEKPLWCPLRPLPSKGTMENVVECDYNRGYVDGRNHCIELITGETE